MSINKQGQLMLRLLECDHFRDKQLTFGPSLNVVLGDPYAANSIGKTSALMVIDFVFGGNSFLELNTDVIKEIGDHNYRFSFTFGDASYYFSRSTGNAHAISICDPDFTPQQMLPLDEYKRRLLSLYAMESLFASFRDIVGRFSRIWGKDNYDVKRPIHADKQEKASAAVRTLIKLFESYETVESAERAYKEAHESRNSLKKASKLGHIPSVSKTQYKQNLKDLEVKRSEIERIKNEMQVYALNVKEVANEEVFTLKRQKDTILDGRSQLRVQLEQIKNNRQELGSITEKSLTRIREFFPEVDVKRLRKVQGFHQGITSLLRKELSNAEKDLVKNIEILEAELRRINDKIAELLPRLESPTVIVDRIFELSSDINRLISEINYFEKEKEQEELVKETREQFEVIEKRVLSAIDATVNEELRVLVDEIYGKDRRSPVLRTTPKNYSYEVFEDTGTGTAYANLVLFDLTVLTLTKLPFLIHDSILFKNIENRVVDGLVAKYASIQKQTFIAIDEHEKYSVETQQALEQNAVVKLDKEHTLYNKDWRAKK